MKNKFVMTLIAFVIFAIIWGIYQSKATPAASETNMSAASAAYLVTNSGEQAPADAGAAAPQDSTSTTTNSTNTMSDVTAQKGDTVFVQYTGKLTDGTVFDSSIPRGQPFAFKLGAGMVIAGWEKGILGMKVGEKKTLTIPAADGYGAAGVPDQQGGYVIPPNATLVFDVELVDVKR